MGSIWKRVANTGLVTGLYLHLDYATKEAMELCGGIRAPRLAALAQALVDGDIRRLLQ